MEKTLAKNESAIDRFVWCFGDHSRLVARLKLNCGFKPFSTPIQLSQRK